MFFPSGVELRGAVFRGRPRGGQKAVDMAKKLPRCECCGRVVHPDRYNAGHQKYCKGAECVRERKRKRQREWFAARYAGDPAFAAAARMRCAAANRRRRAAAKACGKQDEPIELFAVVTGLLSQLTDTTDPSQLRVSLRRYQDRGRRMALSAHLGAGPP